MMSPTLFQRMLGASFFRLPESVRRLHAVHGRTRWAGQVMIERGRNPLARLCARLAGLPPAMTMAPLAVEFAVDSQGEDWHRDFDGVRMSSRLDLKDGLLCERIGPLQFRHALHVNDGALWWTVAGARLFGVLPLPAGLFEGVRCREYQHGERYHFEVEAALPLAGRVIRCSGWLDPVAQ